MNRTSTVKRKTGETDISLTLTVGADKEKKGLYGSTGVGFFDHMLNSFCVHGKFRIELDCSGDLHVDCHHTVEDVGIVLGTAFREIIDTNKEIARFAHDYVPMDETLAFAVIDISNRPCLVFDAEFTSGTIGGFDTQMVYEFFSALTYNMRVTLHLRIMYGKNDHHKAEALFKAAARSISAAMVIDGGGLLSSKGVL